MKKIFCAILLFILCTMEKSLSADEKKSALQEQKSTVVTKKKCNNLICIFDSHKVESVFSNNHALGYDLMDALQEKVAPIIVSANLINNFCYWKTHRFEVIKHFLFNKSHGVYFIEQLIKTNFNGWMCYFHKKSRLVLLIPQVYIQLHTDNQQIDNADPIIQCGFDVSNLNRIENLSYETILSYIEKNKDYHTTVIDDFKSMFLKAEKNSIIPVWNIYLTGHGGRTLDIKIKKDDEQSILKEIHHVQSRIRSLKQKENHDLHNKELWQEERVLKQLSHQLKQIRLHGVSWEASGWGIAGLEYDQFVDLMRFFEEEIKAVYVHYTTCFAGGVNQTLLNQELASLDVNFIVSMQGINESTTHGPWKPQFAAFFSKLESVMCSQAIASAKNQEEINLLIKNSVSDIVKSISYRTDSDYSQPFVRIPSMGIFKALEMNNRTKLLTQSLVKAHEAEDSAIDYTNSSIETLFIYPSYIPVPLKIKDHVAIVSPAPQSLKDMQKPTIHIFEEIFYEDTLFSIIPNFVSFNTRDQHIIFIVKKLHCLDSRYLSLNVGNNKPITISDLIIHIFPDQNVHRARNYLDICMNVVFSHNYKTYSMSRCIQQIQKNSRKLFSEFKNGTFALISDEMFIYRAHTLKMP